MTCLVLLLLLLTPSAFSQVISGTVGVQCKWDSAVLYPNHRNVLGTAMVADLPHNSGPGVKEIIFMSYNCNDGGTYSAGNSAANDACFGVLRILNGKTCELLESINGGTGHYFIGSSPPTLADVDGDGDIEILLLTENSGLPQAWTWDYTLGQYVVMWQATGSSAYAERYRWDGMAIHDLNGDGVPELINMGEVWNALTGARVNVGQAIDTSVETLTNRFVPVDDFDGDGVVDGLPFINGAYTWSDSSKLWTRKWPNVPTCTHTATADFGTPIGPAAAPTGWDRSNFDGIHEVVCVGYNRGATFALVTLGGYIIASGPYSAGGGPPVVGDLDGDNQPEVAMVDRSGIWIWDLECAVSPVPSQCTSNFLRWNKASQDASSAVTGAGIFDFDASDSFEVVYADECFNRIYDGATGEVWFSSVRTSCTWYENPIMANTDDDAEVEIVIGSNANCNVGCPDIDPVHKGIRCSDGTECVSGTCTSGFCACTVANNNCPSGYKCASYTGAAGAYPNPTTPTCRAQHPAGTSLYGISVLTRISGGNPWAGCRGLWNQHTYTPFNIRDDGFIVPNSLRQYVKLNDVNQGRLFRQNSDFTMTCRPGDILPCYFANGEGNTTCLPAGVPGLCPGPSNQGFSAACYPGFENQGFGGFLYCVDIDECALGCCQSLNAGCLTSPGVPAGSPCLNVPGTFFCDCPTGFTNATVNNTKTCVDVDECALNSDDCDPIANCSNTFGSFTCRCPPGFTGTGHVGQCTALPPPPTPTPAPNITGLNNTDVPPTYNNTPGTPNPPGPSQGGSQGGSGVSQPNPSPPGSGSPSPPGPPGSPGSNPVSGAPSPAPSGSANEGCDGCPCVGTSKLCSQGLSCNDATLTCEAVDDDNTNPNLSPRYRLF